MKYEDLKRAAPGGTIDIGRGRELAARLLSPAEDAALRRAIPEPEAPVMKTEQGEPMVDGKGRLVRDDGTVEHNNKLNRWLNRYQSARIAIAIGLETSDGLRWDRSKLVDPAEGHTQLGDEQRAKAFTDAERARKNYCVAAVADMLGDEEDDGLVTLFELEDAVRAYKDIGFGELVAKSAEGNSGSAQGADRAESPTDG